MEEVGAEVVDDVDEDFGCELSEGHWELGEKKIHTGYSKGILTRVISS